MLEGSPELCSALPSEGFWVGVKIEKIQVVGRSQQRKGTACLTPSTANHSVVKAGL